LVEYSAKPNKNMPQTLADLEKFANTLWRIYSALVEVGKVWWNLIPGPIIGKMDKVPRHLAASKLDWRNTKRRMYRSEGLPGSSLKHTIKDINMRQRMEATDPTNVAMNPTITINGVPTGQQGAVAREVQRALKDPIRTMLAQLKTARAAEARLGYI
jgi:hypothetical protein